jgi:hypothetical protein
MKRRNIAALLIIVILVFSCTFVNKQSFEIDHSNSGSPEMIMNEIESLFNELGFRLERKTHITYPKDMRYSEFYIGTHRRPILYTAFDHVILRLENGEKLYIDWVRISDAKEKPRPGYFDDFYRKVASTVHKRTGVTVSFRLAESKNNP